MNKIKKCESGVSPVIGTILLVAITVVLVAIIAAVLMGLSNAEDGKKVGLNAQPSSEGGPDAKLILYGGESISDLIRLEMIDQDSSDGDYVEVWNISTNGSVNVGLPYLAEKVARPPESMAVYDTRINVKGTFTDGREVVLLVQPMTFLNVGDTDQNPNTPDPLDIRDYVILIIDGQDITDNVGAATYLTTQKDGVWTFSEFRLSVIDDTNTVGSYAWIGPVLTEPETDLNGDPYTLSAPVTVPVDHPPYLQEWTYGYVKVSPQYSGTPNREIGFKIILTVIVTLEDGSVETITGTWYVR